MREQEYDDDDVTLATIRSNTHQQYGFILQLKVLMVSNIPFESDARASARADNRQGRQTVTFFTNNARQCGQMPPRGRRRRRCRNSNEQHFV